MQLPFFSKNSSAALTIFKSIFKNGSKLVSAKSSKLSPHIKAFAGLVVDSVGKKSDYREDLKILVEKGVPVKKAAEILGISLSYAYKLLKKK